jgi:hypothetical protein
MTLTVSLPNNIQRGDYMAKTVLFRILVKDSLTGETHKWDCLSEKEKDSVRERMSQNLSRNMSRYFSENPAEYERV